MLPIVYIQLSLPDCRFKIGITGRGLMRRSRNIWKTTPGIQFPVFFCIVLFPGMMERYLHRHFSAHHAPKRRGSGRTEWFRCGLFGVNLWEAVAFLAVIWCAEIVMCWKLYEILVILSK